MTPPRIAIIGAGIAGLACARALAEGGVRPVILDKGRGVGGRLATRRADGGLQFDHGAPELTASDTRYAALLEDAATAGALARWDGGKGLSHDGQCYVGLPGMSGFARHLARGLDIRLGVTVSAVDRDDAGWHVTAGDQSGPFDRIILALPAPQILRLLGPANPFSDALSAVQMSPCLTLMAAFAVPGQPGRDASPMSFGDLERATPETSKPGRRSDLQVWVAHARPEFSRRHLERDLPEIARLMLPLLCDHLGRQPSEADHAVAHRWRFARVDKPLGRPFLKDPTNQLYLGGDWCLGSTAESGWTSGCAIAADILATKGTGPAAVAVGRQRPKVIRRPG